MWFFSIPTMASVSMLALTAVQPGSTTSQYAERLTDRTNLKYPAKAAEPVAHTTAQRQIPETVIFERISEKRGPASARWKQVSS